VIIDTVSSNTSDKYETFNTHNLSIYSLALI